MQPSLRLKDDQFDERMTKSRQQEIEASLEVLEADVESLDCFEEKMIFPETLEEVLRFPIGLQLRLLLHLSIEIQNQVSDY